MRAKADGGERCRTGPHGGRPDVRSAAGPVDGWAGHLNRLLSVGAAERATRRITSSADLHVQRTVTTGEMGDLR